MYEKDIQEILDIKIKEIDDLAGMKKEEISQ